MGDKSPKSKDKTKKQSKKDDGKKASPGAKPTSPAPASKGK